MEISDVRSNINCWLAVWPTPKIDLAVTTAVVATKYVEMWEKRLSRCHPQVM